jgi:uncharacterized C2H2 Zn-finger protein
MKRPAHSLASEADLRVPAAPVSDGLSPPSSAMCVPTYVPGALAPSPFHNCPVCSLEFPDRASLAEHMKSSHSGSRPWSCKYCERSFASEMYLQRHIRYVHQGARDFQCNRCSASFTTSSNLHRHVKGQHGPKALAELKASVSANRTKRFELRRLPSAADRVLVQLADGPQAPAEEPPAAATSTD